MTCSQCQSGGANVFSEGQATSQLKRFRKKGPRKTTRLLLNALTGEGVEGQTLLDIGGGIGAISLSLLTSGVTTATEVDASSAYAHTARAEAAQRNMSDRFTCREGDFVALAEDIPVAGIVTLDRVICCYPNMPALVGQSAAKAARLYGAVYPRDLWWTRASSKVMNFVSRLFRSPLRNYIYPTAAVDAIIRDSGLTPRVQRNAGYWQVVVYARPA
ncbi:MAG: methyltransferase [Chloroflexota bacterium]|nr:methyltransferase [Chloroflexota bacterium]